MPFEFAQNGIAFVPLSGKAKDIPSGVTHVACLSADFVFETPREKRILRKYPYIQRDLNEMFKGMNPADIVGRCAYYCDMYVIFTRRVHNARPTLFNINKSMRMLARHSVYHHQPLVFNLIEDDLACYEVASITRILNNTFSRAHRPSLRSELRILPLFLCLPEEETPHA